MSETRPSDYLGAVIPLPCRVLGTKLKPFALGHVLILERIGCSFITGGPITLGDFLSAMVVCSRDYNGAIRALDSWRAAWQSWLLGWRVKLSGADLISCIRALRQYIEDGSKSPSFWQNSEQDYKRIAAPLPILVKVFLQSKLGYSEQEALNKPYGAALHEYAVALAMDGKLDLIDDEAAKEIEAAKQPLTEAELAQLRKAASRGV